MAPGDHARFVANVEREAQRIQQLVDRMMELIALESRRGLERVSAVPLRGVLHDVAAALQPSAAGRGQSIRIDEGDDAQVPGDAFLLQRAVSNLVSNALDFSPAGATVTLALRRRRRSVELSVRDHGPGIPDHAEHKVFEKFYSLPRPHTHKKSTGLGLAFVKEIVQLHHARATLVNASGGGALATLSLPLDRAPVREHPNADVRGHAQCRCGWLDALPAGPSGARAEACGKKDEHHRRGPSHICGCVAFPIPLRWSSGASFKGSRAGRPP